MGNLELLLAIPPITLFWVYWNWHNHDIGDHEFNVYLFWVSLVGFLAFDCVITKVIIGVMCVYYLFEIVCFWKKAICSNLKKRNQ